MSDILLSVGLQKGAAETSQLQADLQSIISRLDKNPPKVKVGLTVDQSALNHFKSQLTQIVNSVGLSKGAPITVNISGLGEITAKAEQASKALGGVANAGRQAANAVGAMSTIQAQNALMQINTQLKLIQGNYLKWTAAATGQSSAAYVVYGNQIQALEALKVQIQDNTISFTDFKEILGSIKLAASEAAAAISMVGENKAAEEIVILAHDTDEYRNAMSKCNKELVALKKNQEQWTAAKTGKGAADYTALLQYEKQIEALIADLSAGKLTMDEFNARFGAIKSAADASRASIRGFGEDTKSLGDRIKGLANKFSAWLSVSQVIMMAIRAIRQMVASVRDVDKAMTELKKVTNETGETYNKFLENASTRAKQIGASLSDVVNASADFARLGYGLEDAAKLADAALIYKNIGDGIEDVTTASESIISTMQAFGIEASNVMSIVDKFNEVGNNFAISSAGIGEAMQRSAAAMASANNTIEETIALITAANTIVQNPESVGTTLKTVSMYLRAAKTEAEEAGESTDGMAGSVSELRKEILRLTGNKVDIQIDDDTFKSTYQILKELSQEWEHLTDVSQANLLELIGGKRNANVVSALLENFTVAEQALATAADSAGSAMAENEKQLESIEGKIAKFKAAFQTFSQNLIGSDTVKLVVDIGTALIKVLDALQKLHLLLPMIIAASVALKGIGLAKNLNAITNALIVNKTATESLTIAVSKLTVKQKLRLIEDIKAAVASGALTKEQGQQILTTLGLVAADGALTVANKGLAASFKSLMASIPVWGWVALGVSVLIEGILLLTSATDDAAESAENAKKSLSELGEELTTLKAKASDAASAFRDIKDSTAEILPRLLELSSGVDKFGNNVSLTDAEYAEFIGLNNRIAEMFPELNMGFDSNGNAMLALSYSADTLTTSLNKLVEAQRAAANAEIAATMPDVISNIITTNSEYDNLIDKAERAKKRYQKVYDNFITYRGDVEGSSPDAFLDKEYGEAVAEMYELMTGKSADLTYYEEYVAWWDIAEKTRLRKVEDGQGDRVWIENRAEVLEYFAGKSNEDVKAALDAMLLGQDKIIADYQERMRASWAGVNPIVSAWLETDFLYNDLNDGMQQIAKIMASGLDFSSLGLTTAEQVQDYIQNSILLPMFQASPEVKKAFADITDWSKQLKNGEITADEFSSRVSGAFTALKNSMSATEFSKFSSMFVTGMKLINPEVTDFDNAVLTLAESWGYTTDAVAMSSNVFANVADQVDTVKTKLETLTDALDALSKGTLDVWDVIDLLQKFPSLAEYVDLTAKDFGNLEEGLENLIRSTPDDFIEKMQEFKETNNLTGEAAEHIDDLCEAVKNLANSNISAALSPFEQFVDTLSKTDELDTGLSKLSTVFNDIKDGGDFDWSSIIDDNFTAEFGDLGDSYEKFMRAVASSPRNLAACRSAFNELATAYIANSGALDNVTESNRDAVVAMLEQMGVTNAATIVDGQLALGKERLKYASSEYTNMTYAEIQALYNEAMAGSVAKQALAELAVQKYLEENTVIDSTSDIEQLLTLANAANATAESLARVNKAKAIMAQAESAYSQYQSEYRGGDPNQLESYRRYLELKNKANSILSTPIQYKTINPADLIVDFEGVSKAAGNARDDIESLYDSAKNGIEELIDYRKSMLEKDIENQQDALEEQIDALQDFYDEQREMLEDQYDEEEYLAEQHEKQKAVTDLKGELAMLANDDSAWAQRRKLEIQEELSEAEDELSELEKEHALDVTLDMLDDQQEAQEKQIQEQIDALDAKLNDPHALYNQALSDIRNNTLDLYREMIEFNRRYGSGNDDDVADMWNDAYESNEDYRDRTGSTYKDIELGNYAGYDGSGFGKVSDVSATLRKGSTGDGVRALQHALNQLGYGNSGTKSLDGSFGSGTRSAVIAFQRAMGLSGDGVVGSATKSKFKSLGYAVGTESATPGIHKVDELGAEYVFVSPSDGSRYRMFHGGEKVLTAEATDFLYQFANSGGSILTKMISDLLKYSGLGNISKPIQAIEVNAGDIIIQGNANEHTVSEIRRAQRSNLEFVLKSLNSLNK